MGTDGLLKLAKEGCSVEHDLSHGHGGMIYVDGGNLLHRSLAQKGVAVALMEDNIKPLVKAAAKCLRLFTDAGWRVLPIFDGATPPAKADTSDARRKSREENLAKFRAAGSPAEREKFAKVAVGFSPVIVARVSRWLESRMGIETITAPYEADPQLVFMERTFRGQFGRCYIFGNDSDLIVLGAMNLLYEVRSNRRHGTLTGNCISRAGLVNPRPDILAHPRRGKFLRALHGVQEGRPETWCLKPEAVVTFRIVNFAAVDGNDYFKTPGLGPSGAQTIAFSDEIDSLQHLPLQNIQFQVVAELTRVVTTKYGVPPSETGGGICAARWMFLHPLVWDPHSGQQRRLSGLEESTDEAHGCSYATGDYFASDSFGIAVS